MRHATRSGRSSALVGVVGAAKGVLLAAFVLGLTALYLAGSGHVGRALTATDFVKLFRHFVRWSSKGLGL